MKKRLREAERSQHELERRMFHLKTLYDISREIGFTTDTRAIARNLLLMVVGTFGAERGLLLLRDTRESRAELLSHRGLDEGEAVELSRAAEAGMLAPLQVWSGRVSLDEPLACEPLASAEIRAWIPFSVTEHLKGTVALGEKLIGDPYTEDDIELLVTLSNQAAVAIRNAKAHEDLVRYADELAASLRRIQILESIKANLAKFVPKTVQDLIEESPEAPSLDKRDADLSVLFADITGYTRLSSQMEMERVNQLVEVYFGAFLDEILKHGGDVNETAGDGLMVIFRDPDPRRHANSAVLAALGIQRRTQETNATLDGFFEPVSIHVGVNSGIASVGATKIEGAAGTRWTYTASGPTTNIAARLAALAQGGGIVISEETRRRLADEIQVEDMGPQQLKNVPHPVRTYRCLHPENSGALSPQA
jgi:class 3 adenylate cyclase